MLYIASDHAGFERKEVLKEYLGELGYDPIDLGATEFDPTDDYPDYAFELAQRVVEDEAMGIVLCGSGQGVCIASNKVQGIRAILGYNVFAARSSRADDDANILCLPGRDLEEETVQEIVKAWLETPFTGEDRHQRRINKIRNFESN